MSEGRRLPVYLVLDTSGSMAGEPIESVRMGVKLLLSELRTDPNALETAFLSVITFDSSARQVAPLTELMAFQEPQISASGTTNLGEALNCLQSCIGREVVLTTSQKKGDWRPVVFLMTDGQPTDNSWESHADSLKQAAKANIVACAAGSNADEKVLKRVTDQVYKLEKLGESDIKAFFKWVSSSIKTASQSVNHEPNNNHQVNLPPPPPQIQIIP